MFRTDRSRLGQSVARWVIAAMLSTVALPLGAQEKSPAPNPEAEQKAAFEAAMKALVHGPVELPFGAQAKLQLPAGDVFIPMAEAGRLMKSVGNTVDPGFQGLIVPQTSDRSFCFFVVGYQAAGYIKDDEAKDWDAAKLLDQIREGTAEGNKRRAQMGLPEIEITGWIQPPKYEPGSHQMVWSVGHREKGAASGGDDGVNYKTLVLGREGYLSMNLVTDQAHIAELRPSTAALLDGLTFNDGKRYADFNASTDHVAEFGLAALIAGVAAKKLGLLALIVAFVVKFAKVIIVAVAAVLVTLRKRLGLKKEPAAAATTAQAATAQATTAQATTAQVTPALAATAQAATAQAAPPSAASPTDTA
jgi:uncharacterized membrane-anchored protein